MRASTAIKKLSMATATVALTALGTAGSAAAISLYSITDLGSLYLMPYLDPNHKGGLYYAPFGTPYSTTSWGGNYSITVGTTYSVANDINNKGQIVGTSWNSHFMFSTPRPLLWENGTVTDLLEKQVAKGGEAWSINDEGQIAGWGTGITRSIKSFVTWNKQPYSETGTSATTITNPRYASDLNNAGQLIVRDYDISKFLWDNGRLTYLVEKFNLEDFSRVTIDINDAGHVVGSFSNGGGFLCEKGITYLTPFSPSIIPLGAFCYNQPVTYLDFSPYKINNAGQIIGSSFFWDKGKTTNLGSLGGATQAKDINEKGTVVGSSFTSSGDKRAFLWENDIMVDLNNLLPQNSGWELIEARGINDLGQIVGAARFNGIDRAFLINPIPGTVWTPPNSGSGGSPDNGSQRVPEPTSLLGLLAFSVLGIAAHKR